MGLFGDDGRLEVMLRDAMEKIIPRGVSSVTDFSTSIGIPLGNTIDDCEKVVYRTILILSMTMYWTTRMVECKLATVYEVVGDKYPPRNKIHTEYTRYSLDGFVAGSSPVYFTSFLEDENASPSNLVAELAAFFVKRAKQTIKDQEEVG